MEKILRAFGMSYLLVNFELLRIWFGRSLVILSCFAATSVAAAPDKYFGYYGNTFNLQDPYVTEVADHANLNMEALFGVFPDAPQALIDRMLLSKANGLASIPNVDSLLFLNAGTPRNLAINPNAQNDWNRFVSLLQANGLLSNVAAFFIFDEPNGSGIGPDLINAGINIIKANPVTASIPTAVNFAPNDAGGISWYPSSVNADWVGFDDYRYDIFSTATSPNPWINLSYRLTGTTWYKLFKGSVDLNRQKIFLIPQATTGGNVIGGVPDDIDKFVSAAQNDPAIIAILGFVWWSGNGQDWQGLRDSSEKAKWITAGKRLTGKL